MCRSWPLTRIMSCKLTAPAEMTTSFFVYMLYLAQQCLPSPPLLTRFQTESVWPMSTWRRYTSPRCVLPAVKWTPLTSWTAQLRVYGDGAIPRAFEYADRNVCRIAKTYGLEVRAQSDGPCVRLVGKSGVEEFATRADSRGIVFGRNIG